MLKKTLFLLVILSHWFVGAQEDAWVFFTDKQNVEASIANPISILTQRAIDRKARHNVVIDERDVPVNNNYITTIKNADGITVMAKSKWFNAVHVRGTLQAIEALETITFESSPFVSLIEYADRTIDGSRAGEVYIDKFSKEQQRVDFSYGSAANQIEIMNADALHEADYTGEGMLVAVLDSGFPNVDTMGAFQRLRDNGDLLGGYDFVDRTEDVYASSASSHGTRVLSDMAAFILDEFVGTAPDATYMVFRTEDVGSETPVEESYWVEAAERADSLGVDVVNTSLGYKGYDNPNYSYTSENMDGVTAFITRGATMAFEKGMLLVNSAGNSGGSGIIAPADAANVFSIGAVDGLGNYASFSSQGSFFQPTQKPDVAAQGSGSAVVDQNNNVTFNNGTSFSSPIMAGAVASLWQANPELTNMELKQIIIASSSQFETPDNFLGHGIPDFGAALTETLSIAQQSQQGFTVYPNPAAEVLHIKLPSAITQATVSLYNSVGQLVLQSSIEASDNSIALDALSIGLYVLSIQSPSMNTTSKFIKR
jgi:subtilisin family serine protease